MREAILVVLAFAALGGTALASTYDVKCTASCRASDGTTQPAGTILNLVQWNGQTPYAPTDAAGNTSNVALVLDQGGTPYAPPAVAASFISSPAALQAFSFTNAQLTQVKQDGTQSTQPTGSGITGSITHAGRTTTPTTYTVPVLALGGSSSTTVAAVDPVSGNAQVGDECIVVMTSGAFPPVGTGNPICQITSAGTATVKFTAFLSVATSSVTFNVFWRG